jgi:hypothetical protein
MSAQPLRACARRWRRCAPLALYESGCSSSASSSSALATLYWRLSSARLALSRSCAAGSGRQAAASAPRPPGATIAARRVQQAAAAHDFDVRLGPGLQLAQVLPLLLVHLAG